MSVPRVTVRNMPLWTPRDWFGALRRIPATDRTLQLASPWTPTPSHLESWVWADLYGDPTLYPLTRAEAMSVAPLARARHLIVGTAARLPIRVYRGAELVPAQPSWIDRTDRPASPFHRMLWTFDDLLFYGWSLWQLERGDTGAVLAAQRIPYEFWNFDESGLIMVGGQYPARPDLLCLIPGFHEGLLEFAKRAIRHGSNLVAGADRAAETPTPNIELHATGDAPMTDDDIAALVSSWAKARRGANGGVAYTNQAIDVKEHGAHAENLLIEGRNAAAVDIARSCGIPAAMIDADSGGSLTYSNVEGRNREFIDYGLAPYLSAVSARLGMDDICPHGQRVAYDLEEYLSATPVGIGAQDDDSAAAAAGPPQRQAPPQAPRPAIPADQQ